MVAKLIISLDRKQLDVITIDKEVMTIGREEGNDIYIDSQSISGFHCKIITILDDVFLEDLNSTNGTIVNGELITEHQLQDGDDILVGLHTVTYKNPDSKNNDVNFSSTMNIRPDSELGFKKDENIDKKVNKENLAKASVGITIPDKDTASFLKTMSNDSSDSQTIKLIRALTMLGTPEAKMAAIINRHDGYYITLLPGDSISKKSMPTLNKKPLDSRHIKLKEGDIIQIDGLDDMVFCGLN